MLLEDSACGEKDSAACEDIGVGEGQGTEIKSSAARNAACLDGGLVVDCWDRSGGCPVKLGGWLRESSQRLTGQDYPHLCPRALTVCTFYLYSVLASVARPSGQGWGGAGG